jgi:hypothetical protein
MPDGKSVHPTCPESNYNPNDAGTMCLNRSETPTPVGYDSVNFGLDAQDVRSRQRAALGHPADPVETAFERAQRLGWISSFQKAASAASLPPELLMAVAYRESCLDPKYLSVAGDAGHGYGLMQADIRSFPDWIAAGNWKSAEAGILKGAEVLAAKRDEIMSLAGKDVAVKDHSGETYHFEGKAISGDDLLRVTIAAYNCGRWAYYHYSKGHDVDKGTTQQNYSREVLKNLERFRQLLDKAMPQAPASPLPPIT